MLPKSPGLARQPAAGATWHGTQRLTGGVVSASSARWRCSDCTQPRLACFSAGEGRRHLPLEGHSVPGGIQRQVSLPMGVPACVASPMASPLLSVTPAAKNLTSCGCASATIASLHACPAPHMVQARVPGRAHAPRLWLQRSGRGPAVVSLARDECTCLSPVQMLGHAGPARAFWRCDNKQLAVMPLLCRWHGLPVVQGRGRAPPEPPRLHWAQPGPGGAERQLPRLPGGLSLCRCGVMAGGRGWRSPQEAHQLGSRKVYAWPVCAHLPQFDDSLHV